MIGARVLADSTDGHCFDGCATCALAPGRDESTEAWYARIRATLAREELTYERRGGDGRAPRWSRLYDACTSCGTSGTASAEQHAGRGLCRRCNYLAKKGGVAA